MPISHQEAEEAKQKIVRFLEDTFYLLERAIRSQECLQMVDKKMFPAELWLTLQDAWTEYSVYWHSTLPDLKAYILEDVRKMQIEAGGLYGRQLELKLAIVEHLKGKLPFLSPTEVGLPGLVDYKDVLKKLIAAINNLLGSIVAVLGVCEGMKEMKDSLAILID